jgi:hypothetical protein
LQHVTGLRRAKRDPAMLLPGAPIFAEISTKCDVAFRLEITFCILESRKKPNFRQSWRDFAARPGMSA